MKFNPGISKKWNTTVTFASIDGLSITIYWSRDRPIRKSTRGIKSSTIEHIELNSEKRWPIDSDKKKLFQRFSTEVNIGFNFGINCVLKFDYG